jgi:hypothetical protein
MPKVALILTVDLEINKLYNISNGLLHPASQESRPRVGQPSSSSNNSSNSSSSSNSNNSSSNNNSNSSSSNSRSGAQRWSEAAVSSPPRQDSYETFDFFGSVREIS